MRWNIKTGRFLPLLLSVLYFLIGVFYILLGTLWSAERHGGTITLHSAPGQGTRFVVILPADEREMTKRQGKEDAR